MLTLLFRLGVYPAEVQIRFAGGMLLFQEPMALYAFGSALPEGRSLKTEMLSSVRLTVLRNFSNCYLHLVIVPRCYITTRGKCQHIINTHPH